MSIALCGICGMYQSDGPTCFKCGSNLRPSPNEDVELLEIRACKYEAEREQIIALCNRHAQPGVNGQTHEVCYEILRILGEREAGK